MNTTLGKGHRMKPLTTFCEIRHAHLCGSLGGGGKGFEAAELKYSKDWILRQHYWKAMVTFPHSFNELPVFVQATCRNEAHQCIQHVVRGLWPDTTPDEMEDRYYNLSPGYELIEEGTSEILAYRLFESGWRGDQVVSWVKQPLFCVKNPAELYELWQMAIRHFSGHDRGADDVRS